MHNILVSEGNNEHQFDFAEDVECFLVHTFVGRKEISIVTATLNFLVITVHPCFKF
jgi:hypothetical protein